MYFGRAHVARLVDEVARAVDVFAHPGVAGLARLRVRAVLGVDEDRDLGFLLQELVLLLLVAVEGVGPDDRSLRHLADEGRRRRAVHHDADAHVPVVAGQAQAARGERLHVLPEVPALEAGAPVGHEGGGGGALGQGREVLALERLLAELGGRALHVGTDGGIVDLVQDLLVVEDEDQQIDGGLGHRGECELDVHRRALESAAGRGLIILRSCPPARSRCSACPPPPAAAPSAWSAVPSRCARPASSATCARRGRASSTCPTSPSSRIATTPIIRGRATRRWSSARCARPRTR